MPGVGEIEALSYQYAMRIWVNPDKLTDYNLTMDDVMAALRSYNVEVSAGQFGGAHGARFERLANLADSERSDAGIHGLALNHSWNFEVARARLWSVGQCGLVAERRKGHVVAKRVFRCVFTG